MGCKDFLRTAASCRWILSYMICLACLFIYALRFNLSVAIVCMVRPPARKNNTADPDNCGVLSQKNVTTSGEFDWDKQTQGFILSSFFIGYIVTQIPGGWMERRFGGKLVMAGGMFINIAATMLLPGFARLHVGLIIFLRIVMGLSTGVVFPVMQGMWGKWAPPLERSKLFAFGNAGTLLGNICALSLSGLLCATGVEGGWPLTFYVFGGAAALWLIMWMFLAYSSPDEHPRISEEEREYIVKSLRESISEESPPIPWIPILKCPPFWAAVVVHVCEGWGTYTLMTSLPSYMRDVLKFDIRENGFLSALPYIVMFVTANIAGQVADLLRSRHVMSTTWVRKMLQVTAFIVPAGFMIGIGFVSCRRRTLAVAFMTISVAFTGLGRAGFLVNFNDLSPRFAGILVGISNTIATVPGIISPIVTGALTKNGTRQEWQIVFGICAIFYVVGAVIYLIFASGEEQEWSKIHQDPPLTEDVKVKKNSIAPLRNASQPETNDIKGSEIQSSTIPVTEKNDTKTV